MVLKLWCLVRKLLWPNWSVLRKAGTGTWVLGLCPDTRWSVGFIATNWHPARLGLVGNILKNHQPYPHPTPSINALRLCYLSLQCLNVDYHFVLSPLFGFALTLFAVVARRHTICRICFSRGIFSLGATIIYRGGGGLECLPGHIYLFHQDGKLCFLHLRIGCISTMPCGHLVISPIFSTKIFCPKKLQPPPPSILMVAPLL